MFLIKRSGWKILFIWFPPRRNNFGTKFFSSASDHLPALTHAHNIDIIKYTVNSGKTKFYRERKYLPEKFIFAGLFFLLSWWFFWLRVLRLSNRTWDVSNAENKWDEDTHFVKKNQESFDVNNKTKCRILSTLVFKKKNVYVLNAVIDDIVVSSCFFLFHTQFFSHFN